MFFKTLTPYTKKKINQIKKENNSTEYIQLDLELVKNTYNIFKVSYNYQSLIVEVIQKRIKQL